MHRRKRRVPVGILGAVTVLVGSGAFLGVPARPLADPGPALTVAARTPAAVVAGEAAAYTIVVTNRGPGPAEDVGLTVSSAGSVVWDAASGNAVCAFARTVVCDLGRLEPGRSATVDLGLVPVWGPQLVLRAVLGGPATGRHRGAGRVASRLTVTGPGCDVVGTFGPDDLTAPEGGGVVCGLPGDDLLRSGPGDDVLGGGPGSDTVSYQDAPEGLRVDLATGTGTGHGRDTLEEVEAVEGTVFSDHLAGGPGDDRIAGGAGADVIAGNGGSDRLEGEAGVDHLLGGPGADDLRGGGSSDLLEGDDGADRLHGGAARDTCLQGPGPGTPIACEARAYATAAGVTLFEPSERVIGVGFHESMFPEAVAAVPAEDGPDHVVMGSRGRLTAATSAADVVVPSRSAVLTPVSGEVVLVRRYLLYCEATDWQIGVRPSGRTDVLVMILHVTAPRVAPGDAVLASVTPVGTSWGNDAPSAQENAYWPDEHPHVHVEMVRGDDLPVPGCALP